MLYTLVTVFLCLQFVNADVINYASYQNLTRIKRADECGFQCKSDGKCINSVDECNGIEECADGSDETDNCANQWCPNYLFRCNYGACISKVAVCDGNKDCRDNSDETQPGCKTPEAQAKCKNDQFQCKSGECISSTFECNGKADCRDKSDETDECKKAFCFKYLFRCDYGACVDGDAKCNGVIDCLDGSDENPLLCGGTVTPKPTPKPTKPTKKPTKKPTPTPTPPPVTPATNGGCVLPDYPDNGQWKLAIPGQNRYPGAVVDPFTIIQAKCEAGYLLVGKNISICLEGRWNENFKCEQSCPSWESTATTNITCTYGGLQRDCKYPIHDTEAEFYCAPFHEDTSTSNKRYCINSSWNNAKPRCDPICGQKRVKNTPLSIGGTSADEGDYPWQIALFKKENGEFVPKCGGSVLTAKVVITAAHCMITDTEISENKSPVTADFQVAAGKYYRNYHHPKDKHTQYRLVKEILPHPDYRGVWGNYNGDLALLVVTEEFVFGPYVQPVCRDNGNILHLQSGQEGVVTGWGYTKPGGDPAEILTQLKVPFEEDSVCKSKLPEEYVRHFYANDKLCAGYYNQSKAICSGDSGGGLVFPHNGRYYIRGLVSISPRVNGSCDIQQYTLFTKVNWYSTFIDKTILKYDRLI